jgi:guanylate kinase
VSPPPQPDARAPADSARGILFVVSGPSGVGKGEVLKRARARLHGFRELVKSVSVTTRPPRPDETEGAEYCFRSRAEFEALRERDEFLEWAEYVGNLYGTPRAWVNEQLAAGRDVVLEIEVQGALQVRERCPDAVLTFIAPPSWEELRRRLGSRHTECPEIREQRIDVAVREVERVEMMLAVARRERSSVPEYDYVIVNDRLDDAAEAFVSVVRAEHCRARRQHLRFLSTPP